MLGTIIESNNKIQTALTQAQAESAVVANNASDPDSQYLARYNVGAWYVDVYERATGELLGTL